MSLEAYRCEVLLDNGFDYDSATLIAEARGVDLVHRAIALKNMGCPVSLIPRIVC